jgi:signal transduction histidine kinase
VHDDDCGEVESLKGWSTNSRLPDAGAATVPTDLAQLITETSPATGFSEVESSRFAPECRCRLDVEQVRRVIINLVDNAIEATEQRGGIVVETR